MRIGTDVSIQECRNEGYAVMDYNVKEFNANPTDTDCQFTWSLPLYIRQELGWVVGMPVIITEYFLSYNDLYSMYLEKKGEIDSMIGGEHVRTETPDPSDLLNLASDLQSYGLLDSDNI